jgi:hypothetical protein
VSGCGKEDVKSPQATKDGKPLIVIYGDFKCPYCKKVEKNVMPKLKEKALDPIIESLPKNAILTYLISALWLLKYFSLSLGITFFSTFLQI